MKILLLGSGAREHAIAKKIAESKKTSELIVSPGNVGISQIAKCENISSDNEAIKQYIIENNVDMLVVGNEQPLADGIADCLFEDERTRNLMVIGPKQKGAALESSKDFAKDFMVRHNIPTAKYQSFGKDELNQAIDFLKTLSAPYVLKADGLAAGKGVVISETLEQAEEELKEMLANAKFGKASEKVVIEQFLKGIECSVFVLTDGEHYCVLPEAKDYKRIGEGDTGLNTGGMGSVSPVNFATKEFLEKVENKIIKPTIEGLQQDAIEYKGFIFIGLMNVEGEPYVIEYNVRMGDPETESVFPRIESDIVEAFELVSKGRLNEYELKVSEKVCATVFLVSKGYPENYEKGKLMTGFDSVSDCNLFHAGTKAGEGSQILTSGGRVIAVSCFGTTMQDALSKCYENIEKIDFEGKTFRRDIGKDLMNLEA
ncbi:MAG: phosphoribosylamine--glycine ligase [Bacteroidales bacterium]|nr:phosphoribosylamine--glycine ligase [Bacteroidales bacterium]